MNDDEKTKEQLVYEVGRLRRRIQELETAVANFRGTRQGPAPRTRDATEPGAEEAPAFDSLGTQTIDLSTVFTDDVTASGSFSFTGVSHTWFGRLMQALPIPALLLDRSGVIVFMNQACGKIGKDYPKVKDKPFSSLFANPWVTEEAMNLVDKVLLMRLRETIEGALEINGGKMWGRLHLRSIRLGDACSVLVLIEDLTAEKEQLVLKQRHQEEILAERNLLETSVAQRTAELLSSNQLLRSQIAERRRAQDALHEREAIYRALVENSPVGIVSCDREGNVIESNPALLITLGAPSSEAIASANLLTASSPDEIKFTKTIRNCLESGTPSCSEFPYKTRWGRQLFIRMHVAPIMGSDEPIIGVQAVIEDVSDRKQTEKVLLRSERLRALVEMAGGVAHHFSSSLQSVGADAQTALTGLESGNFSDVGPLLRQIRDSVHQTAQTVSRLKQFSRSQSPAKSGWGAKLFDINDTVRSAIQQVNIWWKADPKKKDSPVSVVSDLTQGCTVLGDEQEIVDVVVNLLKNADEALHSGGKILVKSFVEGGQVVLQIQDEGVGIPQKDLGKIGEPFRTTKEGHVGMGLAVSSAIISRHKGALTLTSREQSGTTVTIALPYVEKSSLPESNGIEDNGFIKLQILLICKDRSLLSTMESGLARLDQAIFAASTGREGLDIFNDQQVDAVVCDLTMPDMTGWEVSESIRATCEGKGIPKPVFVMLAETSDGISEEDVSERPDVDRIAARSTEVSELLDMIVSELKAVVTQPSFSGSIHGIDILEYLQLLLLSGRKSVVEIVSRHRLKGILFVDKGAVLHAECGQLEGEKALYKCLSFNGGTFSSQPWREPAKNSINKPGDLLLFEAARRRDEMSGDDTTRLIQPE